MPAIFLFFFFQILFPFTDSGGMLFTVKTTKDIAKSLGLTHDAVVRRIRKLGIEPASRVGRIRYWKPSQVRQIENIKDGRKKS